MPSINRIMCPSHAWEFCLCKEIVTLNFFSLLILKRIPFNFILDDVQFISNRNVYIPGSESKPGGGWCVNGPGVLPLPGDLASSFIAPPYDNDELGGRCKKNRKRKKSQNQKLHFLMEIFFLEKNKKSNKRNKKKN